MPQRRLDQGGVDERVLGGLSRVPDAGRLSRVLARVLKPVSSGSVCVLASTVGVVEVVGVVFEVRGEARMGGGEEPGRVISSPYKLVGLGVIVGGRKGRAGLRERGGFVGFAGGGVGVVVVLVGGVGASTAGVMGVVVVGVMGCSSMGVEQVSGVSDVSSGEVSSAGVEAVISSVGVA